jgi:uncharacterized protein YceK|tara:strand:+ start:43 stop:234 length:192 start_codon:yes stop_codon:yes gene_type:complete
MKNIIVILTTLLLVGCGSIKNPKLSWGKKCTVQAHQVVYSYLWVYGKEQGLDANQENCAFIAD